MENQMFCLAAFVTLLGLVGAGTVGKIEDMEWNNNRFVMSELCSQTITQHGNIPFIVSPTRKNNTHDLPASRKCTVVFATTKDGNSIGNMSTGFDLVLTFKTLDMPLPSGSGYCTEARLDLYDGNSTKGARLNSPDGICGKTTNKGSYYTSSHYLTMELSPYVMSYQKEKFDAVLTPFHTGTCSDDEFQCKNQLCISKHALCDGYNNCGDNSDEDNKMCEIVKEALSVLAIVLIVLAVVIVIAILTAVLCCCGCCCCCAKAAYESI